MRILRSAYLIPYENSLLEAIGRLSQCLISTAINTLCDNPYVIFPFLRNLFLDKMNFNVIPNKRTYITRKGSESQHSGVLKRQMLNEYEVKPFFKKYNIDFVQLEDYNTYEKIKLFMESEIIISSFSGALTGLLFANKNAKIIEICNNFQYMHYNDLSKTLGLNFISYKNILENDNGNYNLDIDRFVDFLNGISIFPIND
jgi:capsular polysaccharide biosynthesis protein